MGSSASYGGENYDTAMKQSLEKFVQDPHVRFKVYKALRIFIQPLMIILDQIRDHMRRMLQGLWYKAHGLVVAKGMSRHELIGVNSYGGETTVHNVTGGSFIARTRKEGWSSKDKDGAPHDPEGRFSGTEPCSDRHRAPIHAARDGWL